MSTEILTSKMECIYCQSNRFVTDVHLVRIRQRLVHQAHACRFSQTYVARMNTKLLNQISAAADPSVWNSIPVDDVLLL